MTKVVQLGGKRYFGPLEIDSDDAGPGQAPAWIKWGDANFFEFIVPPGGSEVDPIASRQLLRVDYKMPTTWTLRSVFTVQALPDEPATFHIVEKLQIGVGVASVEIVRKFDIAMTSPGVYPQLIVDEVFPAQKVNANVSVNIASNSALGGLEYVNATLLIAPRVM